MLFIQLQPVKSDPHGPSTPENKVFFARLASTAMVGRAKVRRTKWGGGDNVAGLDCQEQQERLSRRQTGLDVDVEWASFSRNEVKTKFGWDGDDLEPYWPSAM
ncbi:hypothetical protein JCM1840_007550 [Sporobolomyces johnsonii]